MRKLKSLHGFQLAASDGEIGNVRDLLFSDDDWTIRYLVVDTGSWLLGRKVLISPKSLGGINEKDQLISTNLTQEQVRNSPELDSDRPVSRQYEEEYYRYYQWDPYWVMSGAAPGVMMTPPLAALPVPIVPGTLTSENPVQNDSGKNPNGDPHLRSGDEVTGYSIKAKDEEFGHISDLLVEESTWCVRYFEIDTKNWLPGKHVLVAPEWVESIGYDGNEVSLNLPRATIENAPKYNPKETVTRAYEQRLHEHYGYKKYWDAALS